VLWEQIAEGFLAPQVNYTKYPYPESSLSALQRDTELIVIYAIVPN
jgi:hypothetical protein